MTTHPLPRRNLLQGTATAGILRLSSALLPLSALAQRPPAPPERRLLQQKFPLSTVRANLIPRDEWAPWPRHAARSGWQELPAEARASLIAAGNDALQKPWPSLPATLFLEYKRVGNRARYEAASFDRRNMLQDLVLAECAEGKGRFVDAITNGIWTICEETYWGIPAHVNLQKAGVDLPDVEEPTVDLFAAETGSLLAWTNYLLGEQLEGVSPMVPRRISLEIDRRILKPNAERNDLWWMGLDPSLQRSMNNWNPWINSNWLACNLLEFVTRLSFRSMEIVDPLGITDQPRPLPRWAAFRTCQHAGLVLPSPGRSRVLQMRRSPAKYRLANRVHGARAYAAPNAKLARKRGAPTTPSHHSRISIFSVNH
jgi:hypothetical protein